MQLASSGARPALGRATNRIVNNHGFTQRTLHLPSAPLPLPFARPPPAAAQPSAAQRVVKQTRTLVSRLFAHLATPGLRAPTIPSAGRALHSSSLAGAVRAQGGIQQGFSMPVRNALSRPLGPPHLPRAPAVPRCAVTTVGLGTARSFHSGRPIFQHLAENAPILGRTAYEADLDVRKAHAKGAMKLVTKSGKKERRSRRGQMMKENDVRKAKTAAVVEEPTVEEEMEHYFPAPALAAVSTHLLVPLAPTPTSRMPLPLTPPAANISGRLLPPLAELGRMHASHGTHALRVSSLFARLDAAGVWARGARCEAYGDPGGTCAVLRVVFDGWDTRQVRQVLGEAGQGWCEVHEVREAPAIDEDEDAFSSGTVTPVSDGQLEVGRGIDPAQSFVLPTLDFSSSFVSSQASLASSHSPFPPSPALSRTSSDLSTAVLDWPTSRSSSYYPPPGDGYESDRDSDGLSDCSFPSSSSSDGDAAMFGPAASQGLATSATSWVGVGFSSRFAERMQGVGTDDESPREVMF